MNRSKLFKTINMFSLVAFLLLSNSHVALAQNFAGLEPVDQTKDANQEDLYSAPSVGLNSIHEDDLKVGMEPVTDAALNFSSNYTLGPDDVINIQVMRHSEVSGNYRVNKEGKIQYSFIGDVLVSGKKKDEVKELLTEVLSTYIISPEVTITIVGYNSKIVYVIGEVGRPGKIFMKGDTITVREALVQAGLPLLSAKLSKARVITPTADGKAGLKPINVNKLLYKGDLRENLVMKPGDTLYLPPTIMAKTMRVISPVAAPIGTAAGTGRTITTGF